MQAFTANQETLQWHTVTTADAQRYAATADADIAKSADYTFGNLYMWNETYHQALAFLDGQVLIRITEDGRKFRYLLPIGKGDITSAVEALFAEARRLDSRLVFVGVTEKQLNALPESLLARFTVSESREFADYIYTAELLATLKGKKLHGKRNHINAFSAAHDWQIHPLTPADFPACRSILAAWEDAAEFSNAAEHRAIQRALDAFAELSLLGAVLTVGGEPIAFTIGEMIGDDTLCVHFEKALPAWRGAYPVINREFVRMVREAYPTLVLVNREDDMGLENLRAAKLSYRPHTLLRKFVLHARDL